MTTPPIPFGKSPRALVGGVGPLEQVYQINAIMLWAVENSTIAKKPMNKAYFEEQKNKATEYLQSLQTDDEKKQKISIISQYISSLLAPEAFTQAQNEDLRKLALEVGYQEDTLFADWIKTLEPSKSLELARQYLGKEVEIVIDRPIGSKHPKHDFLYEVNYGFIDGVKAPDGEDLDAYYLGVNEPIERSKGVCIAIAHRRDNDDDKLIVVPQGVIMTDEQIASAIYFQEQWFDTEILRS
jgi:inorganic pyrophosphatase